MRDEGPLTTLPSDLQRELEAVLGVSALTVRPLGSSFGASLLRVTAGDGTYALKWATGGAPAAMLAAEAHGLRALAATGAVRVPAIVAWLAPDAHAPTALLTEWLDSAGAPLDPATLGAQLAALHRHTAPAFGLEADNFIGGTPQLNAWQPTWPAFFRTQRLLPQLTRAEAAGLLVASRRRAIERVVARLDDLLAVSGAPSLIHGDLWGGNVVASPGGRPALIDPAVSYSHREAEVAFTELFGGFAPRFYTAYSIQKPSVL